ncbi:hypothetical protein E2320_012910, partial [Naja naja]
IFSFPYLDGRHEENVESGTHPLDLCLFALPHLHRGKGNVLCMKVKCATLRCSTPIHEPSKCCPRCPDQPVVSDTRITGKACNYSGTIYQHGEMFRRKDILCLEDLSRFNLHFSSVHEESLRDLDGDLIRQPAIRGAPPEGKASFKSMPNTSQRSRTFVQIILNRQKVGEVCISNGKTYSQGETWHPFLRNYGTVECVLCTCNGTKPKCKAIQCPYQYPCEQPKKIEGKCCKVCPEEIESQLPDNQDYFCNEETFPVYEAIRDISNGTLRQIALEKNETSEVEIYTWTIKKDKWKIFSEGAAQINQMCENRDCRTELEELLKVLYLEKSEQDGC